MLRAFLIYLSQADWAKTIITRFGPFRKMALRFVSGETQESAIEAVKKLNADGLIATIDHLGEHTEDIEKAVQAKDDIMELIQEIGRSGVKSNVSIKLSQLGLLLDPRICADNLKAIVTKAAEQGMMVRIDMEDSPVIDQTLELFYQLWNTGHKNIGLVFQSYLYRTEADIRFVLEENIPVRLVKGAYNEPEDLAFPKKADVDHNFDLITEMLIDKAMVPGASTPDKNGKVPPIPGIATHDEARIDYAITYARKLGLSKYQLEFQMLYGIKRDLQVRLCRNHYPVRVYVPYGTDWYPYFMRRLAERPANIWFFVSNFFK